jgi:hypothetical protein
MIIYKIVYNEKSRNMQFSCTSLQPYSSQWSAFRLLTTSVLRLHLRVASYPFPIILYMVFILTERVFSNYVKDDALS